MEAPLVIGLVLFSAAIVFNGLLRLKGKCLFRHDYAVSARAGKEIGFHKTDSYTGKTLPNSDFSRTRIYTVYRCTKCNHEIAEFRYDNKNNPETESLTVELARLEINRLGGTVAPPVSPNVLSKKDIEDLINASIKKEARKEDDNVCLVTLIPEKKQ